EGKNEQEGEREARYGSYYDQRRAKTLQQRDGARKEVTFPPPLRLLHVFLAFTNDAPHPAPTCSPAPPQHCSTLPAPRLTFAAGASKQESSAKEAWEAKGDVLDTSVQHIQLPRNHCPASLAPPSVSSPPCYSPHLSSSAPPATSVHSTRNGA
ncbi:hypothetical protein BT69DRAFT_1282564, partial [Atractiella rhizophila]